MRAALTHRRGAPRGLLGLLAGLALLAGCADPGPTPFDRRMSAYVSGTELQLVSGLGVPNQIYDRDGRRFLFYDFTGLAASTSPRTSFGFGVGSYSGGWGSGTSTGIGIGLGGGPSWPEPCQVTFEMRDDRVLDFERRGNGCR